MKLYLSGPMRGYEKFNFPAFEAAAKRLRAAAYEVVSPHELDLKDGFDFQEPSGMELGRMLARDIVVAAECDGIALLSGWEQSEGARWEKNFMRMTQGSVQTVNYWLHYPIPNPLGLAGPKGVGKSTFAHSLGPVETISFATPIREMLRPLLQYFTEDPDEFLVEGKAATIPGINASGRRLLQTLGTEWGRAMNSRLWVRCAEVRAKDALEDGRQIVFDDVRFPNEVEMIRGLGGKVWRLSREGISSDDSHSSEAGLPDELVDREVEL